MIAGEAGGGGLSGTVLATGRRAVAPPAFWRRLEPLLPQVGITRIAMVTGLDRIGLPVAMAVRPGARGVSVNHGKGATDLAARIAAAMESLEHACAEWPVLEARLASWREIARSRPVVPPPTLPGHPSRLDPDRQVYWVEGVELRQGAAIMVPLEAVSTDYALPPLAGSGAYLCNSSGLASGTDPDEAVLQALLERVERDAAALWELAPAAVRAASRLDLETVDDPSCRALLGRIGRAGIGVALWTITSDIGVPAFRCLLVERERRGTGWLGAAMGTGCHLERGPALYRALAEAAQMRLLQITAARDDLVPADYAPPDAARQERLRAGVAHRGTADFRTIPSHATSDFTAACRFITERLAASGLEQAIIVDLTHPALGIPVVRAIVPGLEEEAGEAGERAARSLAAAARSSAAAG